MTETLEVSTAPIVRIHPHRTKVTSGVEKCVSITPKGGRAYYMGAVLVVDGRFVVYRSGVERAQREQVRNVHAWVEGRMMWDHESQIPYQPEWLERLGYRKVTYHFNVGRFMTLDGRDVTDLPIRAAVCNGRDLWVMLDWPTDF